MLEEWVWDLRDAADVRAPLRDRRADPGGAGRARQGGRRVRQGAVGAAADVLRGDVSLELHARDPRGPRHHAR